MQKSARPAQKQSILVTAANTYLGASLAHLFLAQNCQVFGASTANLARELLAQPDFTFIDVDFTQPLPAYLPTFDFIFHLELLRQSHQNLADHLPIATKSLIAQAENGQTQVIVMAPINAANLYDSLVIDHKQIIKNPKLYLVGDLYGPGMSLADSNGLANLIAQATQSDKIILPNEGLDFIYPLYITDAVFAINKLIFSKSPKNTAVIVSEDAKTALSCAYEIQNTLLLTLGKDIGLFFAGSTIGHQPVAVKIPDLAYIPKVKLAEGLQTTFKDLAAAGQVSESTIQKIAHPQSFVRFIPPVQSPQPKQTVVRRLTKLFPRNTNLSFKKIFLVLTLVFFLALLKTGFDLWWGIKNLQSASQNLLTGQFTTASQNSQKAESAFGAAGRKLRVLLWPFSPISKTASIQQLVQSLVATSQAADLMAQGSRALRQDLKIIANPDQKTDGFDLQTPAANFKKTSHLASYAQQLLITTQHELPIKKQLENFNQKLVELKNIANSAYELSNIVDEITGADAPKIYLVLLMNNNELRPGGGFIGNFGLIAFESGRLKNITVEDIYTIDGQLAETIEPPQPLKEQLGLTNFYLRDSNWSPDFTTNAQTARQLFKKETGQDVEGVMAFDLTFMQYLLEKLGPITLPDYNEQITAANLFEKGQYYSEIGFFPGSTQKRDFFAALTRALINRVLEGLVPSEVEGLVLSEVEGLVPSEVEGLGQDSATTTSYLPLVDVVRIALAQKHLMMTFDNQILASYVTTHGWHQPLPPISFNPQDDTTATHDFLAISEANLGANKVNRFLDRKINYEMTIGRDADLMASLKITYTNHSTAETWPAGKYVNYLRVYVPFAAGLEDFKISLPPPPIPEAVLKKKPKPLSARDDNVIDTRDVEVSAQGNLTVFATTIEVPIKSTQEVTFVYRIPKNIKLETAPAYELYVAKQPGTGRDPLEFKFNLPQYLEVKSIASSSCHPESPPSVILSPALPDEGSNDCAASSGSQSTILKTDLATDRQFEIEVVKK